jgi:hypothetical protein
MNKETLEEAAFRLFPRLINDPYNPMEDDNKEYRDIWISGAKWKQERMYSEEEMKIAWINGNNYHRGSLIASSQLTFEKTIEQLKK